MDATRIVSPSGKVAYAFTCSACGDRVIHSVASSCTTVYGRQSDGKLVCFRCCARQDRERMLSTGKAVLYLCKHKSGHQFVSNWPGTLAFRCLSVVKGRHNIAGSRYDAWFYGPDHHLWHGVQYGEWTQLIHCKRTKEKAA